jgi:hypothetical protein
MGMGILNSQSTTKKFKIDEGSSNNKSCTFWYNSLLVRKFISLSDITVLKVIIKSINACLTMKNKFLSETSY